MRAARPADRAVSRLMLFFALAYLVEGAGQPRAGIIGQPLIHWLKQSQSWTPLEISAHLAVLDIPWIIKPLYGLISDFLPLFGYRRRSYLLAANAGAMGAYLWVVRLLSPDPLILALALISIALAASSTICGALLVENGQKLNASAAFVCQQWLWFNIAVLATSLLGGELVQWLPAAAALHVAALIAGGVPVLVLLGCIALVDEDRSALDAAGFARTLRGLLATLRSVTLWLIAGFLFLYYLSPGFGTPLYFFMTDRLRFSQGFIGLLASISAAGWIAGALLHRFLLRDLTTRALLNLSILFGTLATLAFLGMVGETTAALVNFLAGAAAMIANIATLTLAAERCPRRAEGFTFAALMSVINLATPVSDTLGSYLYEHVFHDRLPPLIAVSAAFTALVFVLVPLLSLGQPPAGGDGPHRA